jgi:hypothetical protein
MSTEKADIDEVDSTAAVTDYSQAIFFTAIVISKHRRRFDITTAIVSIDPIQFRIGKRPTRLILRV